MIPIDGAYTKADLAAARRRARHARDKAERYRGTSAQMRRKLEAQAAMAETEANLIAYALGEDETPEHQASRRRAAAEADAQA
ncbi:hypothetical protein [Salinarimonas sp.]|uniref:hypothetical protein n=1 Tax=Salinarimonas sp. TaxID=2766526 RepID=UPI0032D947CF